MVKISTQGTDPTKTGGGTYIDAEGDFHFGIEGAHDNSGAEKPTVEFDLVVLDSTAPGQKGKKHREKFNLIGGDEEKTKACQSRFLKFMCAIGCYSEAQWTADNKSGADPDFAIEETIGLQFCAPVTLKPGTTNPNAKFANLGFSFWAVGDEESDKVPKDNEWLSVLLENGTLPTRAGGRRKPGTPSANGNGHGKQPAAKPAAAAPRPASQAPRASAPPAATAKTVDDIPF